MNADAVLEVSVSANAGIYEAIKVESAMCQAMRELMKDELAAAASFTRNESRA